MNERIIIADDDRVARKVLKSFLEQGGYEVVAVEDGAEFVKVVDDSYALACLDLHMPGHDGMECLSYVKDFYPTLPVIVISACTDVASAVKAIKEGAVDYITKPFDRDQLNLRAAKAIGNRQLEEDNRKLREVVSAPRFQPCTIVDKSPVSRTLNQQSAKVAKLDSTVLLTGESGTGKTTIARYIHQLGRRKDAPFVSVNCASLPRELIEAELFGHAKGAFTGALAERMGRAELANGGTLFLDEIGDLPLELQPKLLTFLQEKTMVRVGCNKVRQVDVRLIAATHRNLNEMCNDKKFRHDLYYRLNVINIDVPPLRSRLADLQVFVDGILKRVGERHGVTLRITDEARNQLASHHWPGNIRELENVLERAAAFCQNEVIKVEDVGISEDVTINGASAESVYRLAGKSLSEIERQAIIDTILWQNGCKARAARHLGISEKSIYNKLRRLQISKAEIIPQN